MIILKRQVNRINQMNCKEVALEYDNLQSCSQDLDVVAIAIVHQADR